MAKIMIVILPIDLWVIDLFLLLTYKFSNSYLSINCTCNSLIGIIVNFLSFGQVITSCLQIKPFLNFLNFFFSLFKFSSNVLQSRSITFIIEYIWMNFDKMWSIFDIISWIFWLPSQAALVLFNKSRRVEAFCLVSSQPSSILFTWLSKNLGLLKSDKYPILWGYKYFVGVFQVDTTIYENRVKFPK